MLNQKKPLKLKQNSRFGVSPGQAPELAPVDVFEADKIQVYVEAENPPTFNSNEWYK